MDQIYEIPDHIGSDKQRTLQQLKGLKRIELFFDIVGAMLLILFVYLLIVSFHIVF